MAERSDFIRDIIDADLKSGRHQRVATRFPPEPNGYLHIGHAKSICLNFGIANDYGGTCNLRYDDTNPAKEDVEYVESIERDVRWLGFEPSAVLFSADYFPRMYQLAEKLVIDGKAYVCDLDDEQIKEYRGSLTEPGKDSPFRSRSVDENLDLLRRMKAGEFPDGARTLRAKGDMASANMKMRDPLLYRIRHAHHHRSGDQWCIYPMYDYAHPLEDAIEKITHSICTLEFENNRELYDWVVEHTGVSKELGAIPPRQYEFARLSLEYTVMSKRKLLELVKRNHVNGWDDPRMPTISGMRRRGFSAEAIRAFCDMIGIAKANSFVDIGKLEYCVRDELNKNAPRVFGVLDPIEVEIVGAPTASVLTAPLFPPDVGKPGTREVPLSGTIYIDRDDWRDEPPEDYQRLAPGRTVRLRHAHCITVLDDGVVRDERGRVIKLKAKVSDVKKAAVIHWVDAATSLPAEIRIYDRLFKTARPEEGGGDFFAQIDPASLQIVKVARVEASLASAKIGDRFQLERVGYFVVDQDSRDGALVLNRIITLREAYVAAEAKPVEKKQNDKAKTRPKSKSPAEYRTEARVRDEALAKAYARFVALVGPDQADLLTGDTATAALISGVVDAGADAGSAAKWIINELPRALGDRELADVPVDVADFALLVRALAANELSATQGKIVLVALVAGTSYANASASAAAAVESGVSLDDAIGGVIASNGEKVAQIKAGKVGLIGFLVGQVVKAAPGADPAAVKAELTKRLQ